MKRELGLAILLEGYNIVGNPGSFARRQSRLLGEVSEKCACKIP